MDAPCKHRRGAASFPYKCLEAVATPLLPSEERPPGRLLLLPVLEHLLELLLHRLLPLLDGAEERLDVGGGRGRCRE